MDKEFWKEILAGVYDHIMHNCDQSKYSRFNKGLIVADDETSELLSFVKKNLQYEALTKAGKVAELNIDSSWSSDLTKSKNNDNALAAWNKMVAAAYKANHGLLILNVTNIKLFALCWHIKQLAKQEKPLLIWPSLGKSFEYYTVEDLREEAKELNAVIGDLNGEKLKDLILGFNFDGYVLLNLEGFTWSDAMNHALKYCRGEFNAMLDFYTRFQISNIK